jgi:phosphatidylserine decarboxylase
MTSSSTAQASPQSGTSSGILLQQDRRAWHEGIPFVAGALVASALLARRAPGLSLLAAAGGLATAAFFRDPERPIPRDASSVLAASDGVVLSVDRVDEPWWIGGPADRIAVFLSVADVHVNRMPFEAEIKAIRKLEGRFTPAYELRSEHNCRDLIAVEGAHGRAVIAQISGVLARRSVQWCQVGDRLGAGERFGMIRFGSRTDVYLPAGRARILVRKGDRMVGGLTRLARFLT